VDEVIESYTPKGVAEDAAVFAREVVGAASPPTPTRARAWLFAASRIAAFAASVGLEAAPQVILSVPVIERFILSVEDSMSPPTRRTLRSNLKALAAALVPGPAPVHLPRERAKAPYTRAEIAAYLALADAQPTLARAMRASGLICLGAGAGLVGADLRALTGAHVISRSGGLLVEVTARNARVVPVLSCYHDRLRAAAEFFGRGFIVGGLDPARRNVTTALIASLSGGADLARLELGRLRATWLAQVADQIGLRAFMDAAGISCSQRLGDIVAALPAPEEAAVVATLGRS
jgi:integrase